MVEALTRLATKVSGRNHAPKQWARTIFRIAEAIVLYERGIAGRTDTPHTLKRLVVLYRKLKRLDEVRRIQELAKEEFGSYV